MSTIHFTYYKTIQLLVREFEKDFNVADLGSGLQNLILLAIFRTYARTMKSRAVLAIEEPEIFLHPHAQRKLYKILRSLLEPQVNRETGEVIDDGAQIFYATHSPAFLSLPDYDEIFLVRRNDEGKTNVLSKGDPLSQGDRDELRLLTQFNQHRNELFFARKVMLVEGQTEKHAIPLAFAKKVDIDAKTISVIEVGGKGNLPFFIKVLSSLRIEWCAVYDTDSDKILSTTDEQSAQQALGGLDGNSDEARVLRKRLDDHADTVRKNEQIATAAGEANNRLFPLDPNFEGVCGLPAQRTEEWRKTKQAIEKFTSYGSWDEIPELIRTAIEFLLRCPESDWPDAA
ncbi:MAG TPA: TOPRIM nucleotidyl transferase/hydrolase domain-containing protein [Bacteroidota bacterium]|nr:TOPRIM nucleotidyl transferase/hydrolase domain-containing protein [Bacteroidota bacterium]